MSALDTAREHYLERFGAFEAGLASEPPWLGALRARAIAAFAERGLPSTRMEEWHYTNVAALAALHCEAPPRGAPVSREQLESLAFPLFACSLYAFVDGRFEPALSAPLTFPGGSRVDSLAALRAGAAERVEPYLGRLVDVKSHPFAALNTAFLDDGAVVHAPRGSHAEQPVHVVFLSTSQPVPRVVHPRLLIVAEVGSRVTVIQDHVTLGEGPGFTNAVSEVWAGADSEVNLILVQRESDAHFHTSNLQVIAQRAARLHASTLTLGGALVRNDAEVLLSEEGAECTLNGLFVGGGDQVLDNHTLIDHAVPHCTSRELYKGVLGGRARGVFRGRVIVRPDAQKTNASQSNPNLLLSSSAEMNTKPQLEIYADDVKCSHGTSIGQIDLEALFYLRSRGLDEARARDLLTRGFALEVLESLPVPALGAGLDDVLVERLRALRPQESQR
ncbi:MAG: Fe-S cluster assembly protein SufD [Myxococcales bacterium]|nr:Fe-S cluster assembly protein SufD [Myxococcales bacterium]MDH5565386.1 Fe-S cluster assembly protein SufD [Myxococcales bacterium]